MNLRDRSSHLKTSTYTKITMLPLNTWEQIAFIIWLGNKLNSRAMIFVGAGLWSGWGMREIMRDLT